MKLLSTAAAILMAMLGTAANSAESQAYACSLENIGVVTADLSKASGKRQLTAVAAQASQFLKACHSDVFPAATAPKYQIENFYSLIQHLMQAQLKIADTHACIGLGTVATAAWNSPFKLIADTAVYTSVQQALASCSSKRDKTLGQTFIAEPCPLFAANHKYSSAVRVPEAWQWGNGNTSCLYLYGGKNRNKPEEEGIRLRENSPHLILLQMDNEKLLERYIDFSQGELASKELCLTGRIEDATFLAAAGNKKNPSIRIKSHAEHCLRDKASFVLDAVYKIEDGKQLAATDELLISLTH